MGLGPDALVVLSGCLCDDCVPDGAERAARALGDTPVGAATTRVGPEDDEAVVGVPSVEVSAVVPPRESAGWEDGCPQAEPATASKTTAMESTRMLRTRG